MKKRLTLFFFFAMAISILTLGSQSGAKIKNYTVSPKTKITGRYAKSPNLNKYTKHYLLLRTYMEKMEKNGGGTLTLKKGTYNICNILYVASNITIRMQDGVKLIKTKKVGNAYWKAADGIFQVVPYKISQKKNKGKGYSGSKNVNFIGEGKVTMDLKYVKNSKAIVTAHCQNVLVENITFLHMNTGHFLEVDATKNLTVRNCKFSGVSKKTSYTKEAINIDVPDKITGGVNLYWSSYDKTPGNTITIENCTFSNLKRAVGSHKYSQKKVNGKWALNCYHENITIRNNTFNNISDTGVFMLNWKNVSLSDNTYNNCGIAMNFRGVQQPFNISNNVFNQTAVTQTFTGDKQNLYYLAYHSPGKGSVYSAIFNNLGVTTLAELVDMNKAV